MTRAEWASQIASYRTLCRGPEDCGHPEWHRLADEDAGPPEDGGGTGAG